MKIEGMLFDVDGVLYDSMPQHAKSWVSAFREQMFALPEKYVYISEGMPEVEAVDYLAEKINVKISDDIREKMVQRKRDLFNEYKKPRCIKGAKKLIRYLQEQKIKICLVTGSYQIKTITNITRDFQIPREAIVTGLDVTHGKPHPEPFLKAMKKVGLLPDQAIVIENAPLGIKSAKAAGLKCVALQTGLLSKHELEQCHADWVFTDCLDFLTAFIHDFNKHHF